MKDGRASARFGPTTPIVALAGAVLLAAGRMAAVAPQDRPTFRASVDLVAVDVQVVDKTGRPIGSLRPTDFEVSIAGKRRRVVSADFIRSAPSDDAVVNASGMATNAPPVGATEPDASGVSRTFVLAFDTDSFSIGESRDVVASARAFIRALRPSDTVGLYTFPVGPRLTPTLDHGRVSRLVDTIVGRPTAMVGEYHLSASEVIDITAETSRDNARAIPVAPANATTGAAGGNATPTTATTVLQRVQMRECGAIDSACADSIRTEATSKAYYLEGRAIEGLNGLRALIQVLGEQPGRKTVVIFSAGMAVSDRPGGRPDVGDRAKQLGQDAAATNTAIYTLLINTQGFQSMASDTRKTDQVPTSLSRDNIVTSRLLEEFSGASGGAIMRVLLGGGDLALARVLRETSSHYLLGVEPADSDRDGKLKELRVKVGVDGATIRARSWVVVPKRKL